MTGVKEDNGKVQKSDVPDYISSIQDVMDVYIPDIERCLKDSEKRLKDAKHDLINGLKYYGTNSRDNERYQELEQSFERMVESNDNLQKEIDDLKKYVMKKVWTGEYDKAPCDKMQQKW